MKVEEIIVTGKVKYPDLVKHIPIMVEPYSNNMSVNSQAMTPCEPEMRDKAYKVCRDFLSGAWRKVAIDDIVVKRFCGGMSNRLYFCALPNSVPLVGNEPREVLLRIYGQLHDAGVEAVITQSVIFTLMSERCLGPKLYGVFAGGRIEEYIPARSLLTKELMDPSISEMIAEKLGGVHGLQVPISKEPTWMNDTMTRWLLHVRTAVHVGLAKPDDRAKVRKLLSYSLEKELDWILKMIPKINSPVIFSHNDLQEGNILVGNNIESKEDQLIFIDYEYCSYNYRGFDLANHFCEWCYDYTNPNHPHFYVDNSAFPTRDQQLHFIRAYLRACHRGYRNSKDNSQNTPYAAETLLREAYFFTAVSHFFWSLWAIVNGSNEDIEFGYWDYALTRMDAYLTQKASILAEHAKRKGKDLE